ncbi:ribosomal protein S18-alanine N-acetyltransferase [bacterium]|nr:ribosomal protein S18-alanine N-acetyltransferase [bacterium]MBU1990543.1 ribosomal protein S18-alanine N-acetyltransferase [bacterium]
MIIRAAVLADAKKLHLLEGELFKKEDYPLSLRSFSYHIRHNLLLVAEADSGEISGYILVLIRRKKAKIYSLGISKRFRKQGIAALLLTHAIADIKKSDFKNLILEVRIDNDAAIELYKKMGFEVESVSKKFYLDGCDAYIMELKL